MRSIMTEEFTSVSHEQIWSEPRHSPTLSSEVSIKRTLVGWGSLHREGGRYFQDSRILFFAAKCKTVSRLLIRFLEISSIATPRIQPLPRRPIYVIEGNDVNFPTCIATGFPSPTITWSRVFLRLPVRRTFSKAGNLTIVNTTAGDSGMYVCEARNFIGSAREMTQLVVLTIPRFTVKPQENHVVNTGDILTVNCSAQGDQTLLVTWSREYAELPDRRATVNKDGTLTITQVVPMDSGKYICTASSVGGAIKITADMNLAVVKSEWVTIKSRLQ